MCRWRLLAGYQSSFLGQLIQSFECSNQRQMQGIIASISATSDSLKRTDGPWDAILRSVCRGGSFWEDVIPPKNRPVPLHIYSYHTQELDNPDTNSMKRRLNRVLSLSHQANIAMMIADEDTTSTVLPASVISQWTLLQVFVLDAMKDIQSLLDSRLFFPSSKEDEISILFDKATREDQPELPGIVNILLNLMHSAG